MSLRAAIRAKVTIARAQNVAAPERILVRDEAKAYFLLATQLLRPAKPMLIAIGGLSGTGKSVLARNLAPLVPPHPGALIIRSDVERKRIFGVAETERLPDTAYQPEANERVYRTLVERAGHVIAAGHSAILDAVFAQSAERELVGKISDSLNVKFCGLFLTADLATRLQRVGGRSLDASDADAKVVKWQEKLALDAVRWVKIDASGPPESTLASSHEAIFSNAKL